MRFRLACVYFACNHPRTVTALLSLSLLLCRPPPPRAVVACVAVRARMLIPLSNFHMSSGSKYINFSFSQTCLWKVMVFFFILSVACVISQQHVCMCVCVICLFELRIISRALPDAVRSDKATFVKILAYAIRFSLTLCYFFILALFLLFVRHLRRFRHSLQQ